MSEDVTVNPGKIVNGLMKALTRNVEGKAVQNAPQLPLPDSQEIAENFIKWVWSTVDPGGTRVISYLYKDGSYNIDVDYLESDSNFLTSEVAFSLGQALQAAGGYRDNWQNFAGKFISDDFFHNSPSYVEPSKEEKPFFEQAKDVKEILKAANETFDEEQNGDDK